MKALLLTTLALALTTAARGDADPLVGELATITFAHDSAELAGGRDPALDRELDRIAGWALDHPDDLLIVDGHADRTGPAHHNTRLSRERARRVRDALIARGVDPDQVVTAAFGETGPPGRASRRVVVWSARGEPGLRAARISPADRRPRPGAAAR